MGMRKKLRVINFLILSAFLLFLIALMLQLSEAAKGNAAPGLFQDAMALALISAAALGVNLYAFGAGWAWRAFRYILPALLAAGAALLLFVVWPSRDSFEAAFSVCLLLASAAAVGTIAAYGLRYKGSGRPLLEIRRSPAGWAMFLSGVFLLVWSVFIFRDSLISAKAGRLGIASEIFWIVLNIYIIFYGWVRIRVMEDGISHPTGFIPWKNVEDYGWEEDRPQILTLVLKKRRFLPREVRLSIPKSQQDEANNILVRKVHPPDRNTEKISG
jgi:uncharacterized membrane protein YobD (UPF0266 family)